MATALGCAGMAGLFQLVGEVLTLQSQVFQHGAAEMVLREVKTLAQATNGAKNFSGISPKTFREYAVSDVLTISHFIVKYWTIG